ncbi:holo-ACP synthase [Streptomyces sp. NPDC050610]|uniref:holo-ACP synthase n=1 Tax=Streptomyces sp. NPDC050610 TaxID=3157097 RepID=UPI0034431F49
MRRSPRPPAESGAGRSPDRPAPPPLLVRTGTDLTEVARVEKVMSTQPGLRERVFTPRELDYCYRRGHPGEHLAGRWAAKEAVLKSLGTGMGPRMEWTDIEVVNERGGRPQVRLYGEVAAVARSLGMDHIDVSLSHSGGLAVAYAAMVCLPPAPDTTDTAPAHTMHTTEGDDRYEA